MPTCNAPCKQQTRNLFPNNSHLFEPFNNAFQIGITSAETPREPVSAALRDRLPIGDHLELPGLTWRPHRFNAQTFFDHGHETRDLGIVVLSRWAVNDLDLH